MDIDRPDGEARHRLDCAHHSVLHLGGGLGNGEAVFHRQVNVQRDLAVLNVHADAACGLLAHELLGELLGHGGHHGADALDLADGLGRDRDHNILGNVDAAVARGLRQIFAVFAHCCLSLLYGSDTQHTLCSIISILPSFAANYNS